MKDYSDNEEEKLRALLKEKENPFATPSDYFEDLPAKIMDQVNALPDFEHTSDKNPFAVPVGYFETLSSVITNNTGYQKSKLYTWLTNIQRPRIAIPIAFATIMILAGLYFYTQKNINIIPKEDFTADDLRNSSYLQSIDEDLLVDIVSKENIVRTDDSLEQYLIDNNIELSQIENKL